MAAAPLCRVARGGKPPPRKLTPVRRYSPRHPECRPPAQERCRYRLAEAPSEDQDRAVVGSRLVVKSGSHQREQAEGGVPDPAESISRCSGYSCPLARFPVCSLLIVDQSGRLLRINACAAFRPPHSPRVPGSRSSGDVRPWRGPVPSHLAMTSAVQRAALCGGALVGGMRPMTVCR